MDNTRRGRLEMYNKNKFKLGLFGPNCSSGRAITKVPERWSGNWSDNLALANMAEFYGLDFMLPVGRWKGYGGETNYQGETYETITWATGLLAITKKLTVFATVHAPLFHPVIVAKQLVTADHVGSGRLGLNIVCGWNEGEFRMFGAKQRDHEARYGHGQEWLDVVKRMWVDDGPFDFSGSHVDLQDLESAPKPLNGGYPLIMNAGASSTGQEFAVRNCDALFCTPVGAENLNQLAKGIETGKKLAADLKRSVDIYSVGVITCRPTAAEAKEYHHYCIVESADWDAVDNILEMKNVNPRTVGDEEFKRRRLLQAEGMGGIPIIGDPDTVAEHIIRIAKLGLRGIGVSFVNYLEELPFFATEVIPRLEKGGLRKPVRVS